MAGGQASDEWAQLGERLRSVREYLNFSQQYVAERTGIPRSAMSDIERGVRKVDSLELQKLSRLYRHSVGYFLGEADGEGDTQQESAQTLTRAVAGLSSADVDEVVRFARFLRTYNPGERKRAGT